MTEVEGRIFCVIHRKTMVHIVYCMMSAGRSKAPNRAQTVPRPLGTTRYVDRLHAARTLAKRRKDWRSSPSECIELLDTDTSTCTLAAEKQNLGPAEEKRRRLSLKLKSKTKVASEECFPLLPKQSMEMAKKQVIPKNTAKSTQWAVRCFHTWLSQRNERSEEKCPEDILMTDNHCHWLCICISKLRKENGEPYTPCYVYCWPGALYY